jgi:uncharacterized protein (DUF2267 family)
MNVDEFTGEAQHRLERPGAGEAGRAARATLTPLDRGIPEGTAEDRAASLPKELEWPPTGAVREHGQRFDRSEFVERGTEIDGSTGSGLPPAGRA